MKLRHFLATALITLAVHGAFGAEDPLAPQPIDPFEWTKPDQPPAIREVLTGKDYEEAFKKTLAEVGDLEKYRKSDAPMAYLQVGAVDPKSNAEVLGLKPGDVLTTLNGKMLWHVRAPLPLNEEGKQKLLVFSPDQKYRTITFDERAELIGAHLTHTWIIPLWYVRSKETDPRWDNEVMVAFFSLFSNPALCETAWFHAIKKGFKPSQFTWWSAARAAAGQARHHVAFDFAAFVPEDVSREPEPTPFEIEPNTKIRWALQGHRLNYYRDLILRPGRLYPHLDKQIAERVGELIAIHQARPPELRRFLSPTERAKDMARVDLLNKVNHYDKEEKLAQYLEIARDRKPWTLGAATNRFVRLRCGVKDPLTRVELTARFTLKPTDNNKGLKFFRMGIVERGSEFDAPVTLILEDSVYGVLMVTPSYANKANQMMDGNPDMRLQADGKTEYEGRIIRMDGQVEVFLNGRRLAYLPVDDKIDKTDMVLWASGMTVEIKQFQFSRIEEKKQP